LTHANEEEYKLEKIFTYIINQLNKPRDYQVNVEIDERIYEMIQRETEIENQDDDNLCSETVSLNTFTFLYQVLNHLKANKEFIKEDFQNHIDNLQKTYNNNLQYERLDIELFKLQNEMTIYLKSIGVINHYSIAFEYSKKISNIEELKSNIESVQKYLGLYAISDLINRNAEIILMDDVEFSSKLEYIVSELGIPTKTF